MATRSTIPIARWMLKPPFSTTLNGLTLRFVGGAAGMLALAAVFFFSEIVHSPIARLIAYLFLFAIVIVVSKASNLLDQRPGSLADPVSKTAALVLGIVASVVLLVAVSLWLVLAHLNLPAAGGVVYLLGFAFEVALALVVRLTYRTGRAAAEKTSMMSASRRTSDKLSGQ